MSHWAHDFFPAKTVIVVGGTSGIRHAIASAFADAGAGLTATGATDAEVAAATGTNIAFHKLDVRDNAVVSAVAANFGPVAALVDCAGVNLRAAEWTPEGF